MKIDHFMYAVADLDEGMAWAEDAFGSAPVFGGSHEGLGTRNALLSLGDTYLDRSSEPFAAPDRSKRLAALGFSRSGGP